MKNIFLFLICAIAQFMAAAQKPKVALNHIALHVVSLQKSTLFYQHLIGLDTIPEPFHDGKHTWFRLGEHSQLHLIGGAAEKAFKDKNTHLCFSVRSINGMIEALKKAGRSYENWAGTKNAVTTRPDGINQIYFQDPDGNWIEINDDHF